ncbi:MAG: RNA polymerase sigma-70 factor ECF subfamily [Puniceicoccaceae bacterium 5H]|nr:MAG: RNA polymerase sigma-70 factor ECF subfamily [Puniceicoccaceae bacterium 5H]
MAGPAPTPDFRELVAAHYQNLYRFALSLARNPDDAADLVQQTFLRWAKKGHTLRDTGKVKSWLFTTLYREFLRIHRKGKQTTAMEPEILELETPPVEADVAQRYDSRAAVEALEAVDEVYRAPLSLFYLEDLSYKEIAEVLDVPIGTVMSRLSRGKAQLKKILTEREK